MARQRNDATASAQGMVFQFFAALDACFNMNKGEEVCIERFGDVTILSSETPNQVEVKKRIKKLSDYSEEFWNTIYNWIKSEIPWKNFTNLVYLTTQEIVSTSVWAKWNDKSTLERYNGFKKLLSGSSRLKNESKERLVEIDSFLSDEEKKEFVQKIVIATSSDNLEYWRDKLTKYIRGVPQLRTDDCINSLLGFITQKGLHSKGWSISYDEFNDYMEGLSQSLVATTTAFPILQKPDLNVADYQEKMFVTKLREIRFNDEDIISDAVVEYATAMLHNTSFSTEPHRIREYVAYQDNLCKVHKASFNKAKYSCDSDIFRSSQLFYLGFKDRPVENFGGYLNTPIDYRNGVVQILADEDRITWLLKPLDMVSSPIK